MASYGGQSCSPCYESSASRQPSDLKVLLGDLQRLLDDKDICIEDMETEMKEMKQLLAEAVQENDSLRCKLEDCQSRVRAEDERMQNLQGPVAALNRLMSCSAECVPCREPRREPPRCEVSKCANPELRQRLSDRIANCAVCTSPRGESRGQRPMRSNRMRR